MAASDRVRQVVLKDTTSGPPLCRYSPAWPMLSSSLQSLTSGPPAAGDPGGVPCACRPATRRRPVPVTAHLALDHPHSASTVIATSLPSLFAIRGARMPSIRLQSAVGEPPDASGLSRNPEGWWTRSRLYFARACLYGPRYPGKMTIGARTSGGLSTHLLPSSEEPWPRGLAIRSRTRRPVQGRGG